MNDLKINTQSGENGITTVHLTGSINTETSPDIEKMFNDFFYQGKYKFIFDLSGVTYLNSCGIGIFFSARAKIVENNGNIVLVNPSSFVTDILSMLGVDKYFKIADDIQVALKMLSNPVNKIMVLDDELLIGPEIKNNFSSKNYELVRFSDFKEASEYLKSNEVKLIIINKNLSDSSCVSAIKSLKESNYNPLIIIAYDNIEPKVKAELTESGISDYCNKLFGLNYLAAVVKQKLAEVSGK